MLQLQSYIYPALHGAYGFVYDDDGGSTTGTPDGCELVVETDQKILVYELDTFVDPMGMNKFHVNVATEDRPSKASVYCKNEIVAERELDGPRTDTNPLTFTVNGAPFSDLCEDTTSGLGKKDCEWVGDGGKKKVKRRCKKKSKGIRYFDWCPKTCAEVGLRDCAD